jgi:hypothetical protein
MVRPFTPQSHESPRPSCRTQWKEYDIASVLLKEILQAKNSNNEVYTSYTTGFRFSISTVNNTQQREEKAYYFKELPL